MRMLPRRLPPSGLPAPRPCLRLLVLVVLLMDGYVVGYTFQPPLLPSSRSTTSPWPSRRACKLAQPRVGRGVAGARASNVVVMASTSVAASAVGFKKGAPIPAPQYGDTQGAELFLDHVSVAAGANRLISDGACAWRLCVHTCGRFDQAKSHSCRRNPLNP